MQVHACYQSRKDAILQYDICDENAIATAAPIPSPSKNRDATAYPQDPHFSCARGL